MILTFPWPPKELSPNSRCHWAVKAKAAKKYKNDCLWICKEAKLSGAAFPPWESVPYLSITFNPPDGRRRDRDNMLASSKQIFDAISEVITVDDSYFRIAFDKGHPIKHGSVTVAIS